MHSCLTHLHVQIKNGGVQWYDGKSRWLCAYEVLVSQGFPIHPYLVNPRPAHPPTTLLDLLEVTAKACSFSEAPYVGPDRKRGQVVGQAGNAMHVNVVGVGLLWAYLWCIRVDQVGPSGSIPPSAVTAWPFNRSFGHVLSRVTPAGPAPNLRTLQAVAAIAASAPGTSAAAREKVRERRPSTPTRPTRDRKRPRFSSTADELFGASSRDA